MCVLCGENCHQVTTETEVLLLQLALCFLGLLPLQRPVTASSSALVSEGRFGGEVAQRKLCGFLIAPSASWVGKGSSILAYQFGTGYVMG